MSVIKTIRTIRYLKIGQITGQIRNRLRFLWDHPDRFFQIPNPEFNKCQWALNPSFLAPGAQINTADNIKSGRFVFLNKEEAIGWPLVDWDVSELPKLWRYNLHYFEWLWALDHASARGAIIDWIVRHTLTKGRVGWEPYPMSLRLINWCAIFFGKFRERTEEDEGFARQLWRSIFIQVQWLCRHLETHLLGNHLFENAAALAFVGSCFSGKAGQDWLNKGLQILNKEIPEQILPDGMHFERSPMYHVRMTYLMRLLLDTGNEKLKNLIDKPFTQMQRALAHLCHPDGQIALLNDSAFGIYNAPDQLVSYTGDSVKIDKTGPGNFALPDAGYYGHRDNEGTYIICDAGRIGPDYIPGHAHADMFSFELSLKGHRVVVDSGVYDYEVSPMRRYCRSTKAHNTLEINEQDQCEMWAAFRVARRGQPNDIQWKPNEEGFAKGVLLPALANTPARLAYLADLNAAAAKHGAAKFGIENAITDYKMILDDPAVNTVFVLIGHHLHARFVIEILEAGKNVFVEKPLAMNEEELCKVEKAFEKAKGQQLMLGFNRRFSPHTVKIKELLAGRNEPLCMNMTINGGAIPADHWTQDPERGGGRIIGEGCHFIDLLSFLADSSVKRVPAIMVGDGPAIREDKMSIVLGFEDGSVGTINYFANGAKSYPKETLEIFSDGRVLRMDNFRKTTGFGFKGFKSFKTKRQDKGHTAEIVEFIQRIKEGGEPMIAYSWLDNITRASFAAVKSAREVKTIQL